MPSGAGGFVASPGRSWLLATCAFGFALVLWNTFATPRFLGRLGISQTIISPLVVRALDVEPGSPAARAGLRAGDEIELPRQGVKYRNWLVGQPVPMRVQRGDRVFYRSIVPVAQPLSLHDWLDNLTNWWWTVFATIVAWFGVGRRARLLSWLLILGAMSGAPALGGVVTPWPWLNEAAYLLNAPAFVLGITLLATISSTFGRPLGPPRRILELSTYAVAVIGVGVQLVLIELILTTPWFDAFFSLVYFNARFSVGVSAANVLALACALVVLATVRGEERQRAAWLLIPLGAIFAVNVFWGAAAAFVGVNSSVAQQQVGIVGDLAMLVALGVMSYAVLSRRLLDVQFVINRAAVFAGVSLVVVGIFVLVEFLFNKFLADASHTTGIVVSICVALVIGVSLQYIHRYIDKVVDVVFFRARHEHERSLRAFAHEAAFITDPDTLLDDAVQEVAANGETDAVSILLLDERGTYTTARSTNGEIDTVSENDRAILKLRAWHSPIDLADLDTALAGSRAYPLISRGDLLGVLVCGEKRDGQAYAPDESEALALLARSVGAALDALRRERRDDLTAAIDDLKDAVIAEIRGAVRELSPTADGGLPISTLRPPPVT